MIIFLAIESIFGLIWALQPLSQTARGSLFVFGIVFFSSYFVAYLANQLEPVIETSAQQMVALAPLAAIKMTMDTLGRFHYMFWAMNFDNWHLIKLGWSLRTGVQMFVVNLIIWAFIGIFLDILFTTPCQCLSKRKKMKVTIENSNENTL